MRRDSPAEGRGEAKRGASGEFFSSALRVCNTGHPAVSSGRDDLPQLAGPPSLLAPFEEEGEQARTARKKLGCSKQRPDKPGKPDRRGGLFQAGMACESKFGSVERSHLTFGVAYRSLSKFCGLIVRQRGTLSAGWPVGGVSQSSLDLPSRQARVGRYSGRVVELSAPAGFEEGDSASEKIFSSVASSDALQVVGGWGSARGGVMLGLGADRGGRVGRQRMGAELCDDSWLESRGERWRKAFPRSTMASGQFKWDLRSAPDATASS